MTPDQRSKNNGEKMAGLSDLEFFIKTGIFLGLRINSSVDDVVRVLGEPDNLYDEPEHSAIYNYGNIEIIFGREGIASIEIKFYEDNLRLRTADIDFFKNMKFLTFVEMVSRLSFISYQDTRVKGSDFAICFGNSGMASFQDYKLMTLSCIEPGYIY